jgi:3-deoxy-7-phosphoheptulonate synthase
MIIHLKENISSDKAQELAKENAAILLQYQGKQVLVNSSSVKELSISLQDYAEEFFVFPNDMQLASKEYLSQKREVKIGEQIIGGKQKNTLMMAGPCSVESEEQIRETAALLKELDIKVLRAGSYKPRTSPYSFQGMGLEGLKLLDKMREEFGFSIITEVRDSTHIDDIIAFADIVQIGAKSMYDHGILRKCGKINKPVLLKRGFGTTLQEFVQAAEFILSGGNANVILCERGIRTFETKTRFSLDLSGVAYLKEFTNLPIVLDPSHAMGYAYGVPDLARACVAMGVEGVLIEVHPNPKQAKSDASQQLNHNEFKNLYSDLHKVAQSIGHKII